LSSSTDYNDIQLDQASTDLIHNLIEISCDWIDQQIQTGFPGDTKRQCFSLAYVWSINREKYSNIYYQNRYLQTFLAYFMDISHTQNNQLDNLTGQEFVFCVYLSGLFRKFPNSVPDKQFNYDGTIRNLEFQLCKKLEQTILQHLGNFCLAEVGIVAHALYKSRLPIKPENSTLRNSLITFMLTVDDHEIIANQAATVNILKVLTSHDFTTTQDQIELTMQKFMPLMSSVDHFLIIR
jgi:hypothetical protein